MNQTEESKGIRCHLSEDERYTIQHMLDSHKSIRIIAKTLGRSPSTILREINRHVTIEPEQGTHCLNNSGCKNKHMCGNTNCKRNCRGCGKCKKYCPDYVKVYCDTLQESPYLCNGCNKYLHCTLEHRLYKARIANKEYNSVLIDRRSGYDLTGEELEQINRTVSPLLQRGLSPYHIKQTLGDELSISESTLRRLIAACELDARNIDLREQVKRKPRTRTHRKMKQEILMREKEGKHYKDYLEYIKENDVMVVQMDCVEGIKEDSATLLTLHFPMFSMQIAILMPEHTSAAVVDALNLIEAAIGPEIFRNIFEVILTDNGTEFTDIAGMERSISGGKRTRIFFCEPNRSDEKGSCENNHKLIRYVIPKGTSLEQFRQEDITLMMNHINSYKRKALGGNTPYQMAQTALPEEFFDYLGLYPVLPEEVLLKPCLLKKIFSM